MKYYLYGLIIVSIQLLHCNPPQKLTVQPIVTQFLSQLSDYLLSDYSQISPAYVRLNKDKSYTEDTLYMDVDKKNLTMKVSSVALYGDTMFVSLCWNREPKIKKSSVEGVVVYQINTIFFHVICNPKTHELYINVNSDKNEPDNFICWTLTSYFTNTSNLYPCPKAIYTLEEPVYYRKNIDENLPTEDDSTKWTNSPNLYSLDSAYQQRLPKGFIPLDTIIDRNFKCEDIHSKYLKSMSKEWIESIFYSYCFEKIR